MSGPKVDYAKLREQEMASLAEARGRRLKVADKIQKMINQIDSCLGGDVDLMLQDPQIGPSCKKIQELQAQYKKELQALYNTVKHGTELLDVDAILHGRMLKVLMDWLEIQIQVRLLIGHQENLEKGYGVWDMGHIPEAKYSEMHEAYMNGELTTKEFVDWYNDPANYRLELPSNNRSHKYE